MKSILTSILCVVLLVGSARAQSHEAQQLLLNVEKLSQFKQLLKDMKKGYEILTYGYNTVKDISQGNFSLHKTFLDGLLQVSPTVRNYRKVAGIVNYQITLVDEYRSAFGRFRREGNFTPQEIQYLSTVYGRLFDDSLRNLDDLATIITAGRARMSDDERLREIDRIFADMEDKVLFLRNFNNNTSVLALQRAKERKDAQTVGRLHGINPNQ
ncbi:TerB family tellurite resistance protein [Flavobacterium lindanitolerans]|uniref:TerB family tellurite resistance protein n=1 Tax=Flavobacterium lindanitolerans TaxID=428988 RepID=UPI0023F0F87F|nr:TerB family tellurite resistance protein [Flavobacterium lindanitolerans]